MKILRAACLAVLAAWAASAYAQTPLVYPAPFAPIGASVALSVSNASSNVQLGWVGVVGSKNAPSTVWVCNTGTVNAYVALGANSSTAADTTGFTVVNGQCNALSTNIPGGPATYLAAVTASSTTTLTIATGNGSPLARRFGPSTPVPVLVNCLLISGTTTNCLLISGTTTNALLIR